MAGEIAQLRAVMMTTLQSIEKLSADVYGTKKSKKVSIMSGDLSTYIKNT